MSSFRRISVPDAVRSRLCILSLSGGKDSVAAALALREAGLQFRMVFADTMWEAAEHYEHMEVLRKTLGDFDTVSTPGGMLARAKHRAGWPARMQRWCTQELKIFPLRKYHDDIQEKYNIETVSVAGIRAEESERRSRFPVIDDDEEWGGYRWNPILDWGIQEVIAIHHRHNVPLHPLYKKGFNRVGCFPCIFANKSEIARLAQQAPERIEEVAALEEELTIERRRRNEEKPGRYTHDQATFFQARGNNTKPTPIREVVKWALGNNKQLPLLDNQHNEGCFRWGTCEPPSQEPIPDEMLQDETPPAEINPFEAYEKALEGTPSRPKKSENGSKL